jgi:hypothetical protein
VDQAIIFFFAAIIIVGGLLFAVMSISKKGSKRLDVDRYRSKWLSIEQQLQRDQPASYHLCVLNADKLLDQALVDKATRGGTMAERLKTVSASLTNRNAVWSAHKLRNAIAHDIDARVSYDDARLALAGFRKALKDIGAI